MKDVSEDLDDFYHDLGKVNYSNYQRNQRRPPFNNRYQQQHDRRVKPRFIKSPHNTISK